MARFLSSVAVVVAVLGTARAHAESAQLLTFLHSPNLGAVTVSTRNTLVFAHAPARLAFAGPAPETPGAPGPALGFSAEPVAVAVRGLAAAFSGLRPGDVTADFTVRPGPDAATPFPQPAAPRPALAPDSIAAKGGLDLSDNLTWKFADGLHYSFSNRLVGSVGYVGVHLDKVRWGFTYRF